MRSTSNNDVGTCPLMGNGDALRSPIAAPKSTANTEAARRLADLATPPGALGKLGDLAVWIASAQGQARPTALDNVRLVIFAGDHGVAAHGVSASTPQWTGLLVRVALEGGLAVNSIAAAHGVTVRVLDLGVDDEFQDLPTDIRSSLQAYKVRRSSGAIHLEDALSGPEVREALVAGVAVAHQEAAAGAQLLISGDIGTGNTTSAAALVAATLGLPARRVVGRGTGIDDVTLQHKAIIIQTALARVGERSTDPIATLAALGSADLAATTGYLLTAARLGIPVLLDGLMAIACALIAERIAPGAAAWFAAGHRSTEPAQGHALADLGLVPILNLEMRLGEGSGAVAAVPVLRGAVAVLAHTAVRSDLLPRLKALEELH